MTPFGMEPATFRFVAQHLNHCATVVSCPVEVKWFICLSEIAGSARWLASLKNSDYKHTRGSHLFLPLPFAVTVMKIIYVILLLYCYVY